MATVIAALSSAILASALNLGAQLALRRTENRRDQERVAAESRRETEHAARIIYDALLEHGNTEINSYDPPDATNLHAVWREHRAAITPLGRPVWNAVEDAVMWAVDPSLFPIGLMSHNERLEHALMLLEEHIQLPLEFRVFS